MATGRDRGKEEQMKIDNLSMGIYDISGNLWRFWDELTQFRRYFDNSFSALRKCIRKEG
jgi:hypothetical protein